MEVKSAITRARRGLREELRLYVVAVSSLAVAFLCLGATLLGVTNLDAAATRWGQSGRITLFLKDDADAQDNFLALKALLDDVNVEDRGCTEKVYKGLNSNFARPGHLSHLERPNYDFARYLLDRVDPQT